MSIKWLGSKVVQLDTVKLPVGHAKRRKEAHVKDLAASIERSGVIELPVVRVFPNRTKELVAGGDRFAALQILGFKKYEVRLVSGTDEEMEVVSLEENLTRRRGDDYDRMAARLVEITTGKIEAIAKVRTEALASVDAANAAAAEEAPKRKPGRPKSAKGEAREEVAKNVGKTPEAIRAAEKRARSEKEEEIAPHAPMAPPVDTFDLELAESIVRDEYPAVRVVQETLNDARRKVDGGLRSLTINLKMGGPHSKAAYDHTYSAVQAATDAIRRATPESVCPWCKADLVFRMGCSGCGTLGFVSSVVLEGVAPELLKRGPDAMVTDGRGGFALLAATRGKPSKAAKGAKKVKIVNEHGEGIAPEDESQAPPADLAGDGLVF